MYAKMVATNSIRALNLDSVIELRIIDSNPSNGPLVDSPFWVSAKLSNGTETTIGPSFSTLAEAQAVFDRVLDLLSWVDFS